MKKTILFASLIAAGLSGQALAIDLPDSKTLRIESEAQFVRDNAERIERVGDGVYLFVSGSLAGRTVSIGKAGLAFDMKAIRARIETSGKASDAQRKQLSRMQQAADAFAQEALVPDQVETRAAAGGALTCLLFTEKGVRLLSGSAVVEVNAEFALPIRLGYYAYADAWAFGQVDIAPFGFSQPGLVVAEASAHNVLENEDSEDIGIGPSGAQAYAAVSSGPAFNHDVSSFARVYATGDCWGYVSLGAQFSY